MELEEYAAFVRQKRRDEAAQHAARVREQRRAIEHEIEDILADPDVEDFAERMSDERPRTAEDTLALVRGTDVAPTVTKQAEERSKAVEAGKRKASSAEGNAPTAARASRTTHPDSRAGSAPNNAGPGGTTWPGAGAHERRPKHLLGR